MNLQIKKTIKRLKLIEEAGKHGVSTNTVTCKHYNAHWHDFYEIEIVASGEGTFSYNGTEQRCEKGHMMLMTPADFHTMTSCSGVHLINIEVGAQWFSETMRSMMSCADFEKSRQLSEEELSTLLTVVDLLTKEYENDGPCIQQLLEYIFSRFMHGKQSKPFQDSNREYTKGIMKAISYMEQNFQNRITLETLSDISGYHPTYFSKMFNQITGETYIERLTLLRVNYAKMLLRKGASVSEARAEAGFGSYSNFSAVFRKRCGMSPSEYRSKHRENQKDK